MFGHASFTEDLENDILLNKAVNFYQFKDFSYKAVDVRKIVDDIRYN